jgi:hypothetical protein
MKFLNIKNVVLAVAAIALGAPAAQAQTHRNIPSIPLNSSAHNGAGFLYRNMPYLYNSPGYFYPQGAIVLGANGQIYDTTANNGIPDLAYRQNGLTIPARHQLSDKMEAIRLPDNRIEIRWDGDTHSVASMKFSLLNRKRAVLQTAVITDLPSAAIFAPTAGAVYYRVMITYSDGAVRSLVATL